MIGKLLLCAAVVAGTTQVGLAQDGSQSSPWNGTWKMNREKSKLTGGTFTVTSLPDGKMKYSNGSTMEYTYACDGQTYPAFADRLISCTGDASKSLQYTVKTGDTVLTTWTDTLSADGKTFITHGTSKHADGTSTTYDDTNVRVSGGQGFTGTWKNVKTKSNSPGVMQIAVNGDTMHVEYPTSKEMYDAKLDGTPAEVKGPTIPPGATITVKQESATRISFAGTLKDKTLFQGTQSVSADGKTITEEEWDPGKESEKEVAIYDKQ